MFRAECMIQRVMWALHRMALGADLHWRPLTGDNADRSIHAEFEAASAFGKQDSC
jgi:hypothetical protein